MISLERKRTERSRKPFLLMLLDMGDGLYSDSNEKALDKVLSALSLSTRETDVTGWYKNNIVVGVMFTEFGVDDRNTILTTVMTRVSETLRTNLSSHQFNQISISFHLFPEEWNHDVFERPSNPKLYPDLTRRDDGRKLFSSIKRIMDTSRQCSSPAVFVTSDSRDCHCHQADLEGPRVLSPEAGRTIRRTICLPEVPVDVCQQRCQRA